MAIKLPGAVFSKFNEAIQLFERTATLVYPERRERCGNCITNTIGGRSTNLYRTGGPISFSRGTICPLCGGRGFKLIENKETVNLRIYHDRKSWVNIGLEVDIPNNAIQTVGYMSDYPKLTKAKELLVDIGSYNQMRYKRSGEPIPQGFKQNPTQYIVVFWERV